MSERVIPALSEARWTAGSRRERLSELERLNRDFIAVKVDREARPDIDAIYMSALHAMGERGGWPLNVFVTPERKPFFGGTYFPPGDRGGRPGFSNVLRTLREQFDRDPAAVDALAERVATALRDSLESRVALSSVAPSEAILRGAREDAGNRMDVEWGGQRGSPKFPSSLPLRFRSFSTTTCSAATKERAPRRPGR